MTLYYAQADGDVDTIAWNTVRLGGGTALVWPPAITDDLNAGGFDLVVNDDIDVEDFDLEDGSLDIEAVTFRCRGNFNADGPSSITSIEATAPTIVVDGDLTLVGTSGNLVTVNNVDFDVTGSATAAYTSATDSDASAGNPIFTSNFTNGGGNKWWGERWFAKANGNFSNNTNWNNAAARTGIDMTAADFNAANTYSTNSRIIELDLGTAVGTPLRFVEINSTNAGNVKLSLGAGNRWIEGYLRAVANSEVGLLENRSASTITHTGNSTGGTGAAARCLVNHVGGQIISSGNTGGGSGSTALGAHNVKTGIISIGGTASGGSGVNARGIQNSAGGTINVANLVGHATTATSPGCLNVAGGTVNVTGSLTKGAAPAFSALTSASILRIIGTTDQTYTQADATSVGIVQVAKASGKLTFASPMTCASFTATGPARIEGAYTITVTGNLALNGTQANRIYIIGPDFAVTGAATASWCYVKDSASTGTIVLASSSYGESGNTGWWFAGLSTTDVEGILDARYLTAAVGLVQQALASGTLLGEVVADAGNSTTQFKSTITGETANFVRYAWVLFYDGALQYEAQPVATYDGTTGIFTVASAFTATPAAGTKFILIGRS